MFKNGTSCPRNRHKSRYEKRNIVQFKQTSSHNDRFTRFPLALRLLCPEIQVLDSIYLDRAAKTLVSLCGEYLQPAKDFIPVNPPDERICRQEAHRPRQEAVHGAGQEAVAEEEKTRHKSCYVQLEKVVPDTVRKNPKRAAASRQEALPPPMIVLRREIQVSIK